MQYLLAPTLDLRDTYLDAMREHTDHEGRPDADGLDMDDLTANLAAYVADHRDGASPRPGVAPVVGGTELWWCETYDDGTAEYIGRASIRHHLDPALYDRGGQIRISIRPARRRQGLGTELLAAALTVATGHGMLAVMLICRDDDPAACKIIERSGGQLARVINDRRWYQVPTT